MDKPELISVEFLKNQPPYLAGEQTGRSAEGAAMLVGSGVAKYVTPPPGLDEFGERLEERDPPKAAKKKPAKKEPAKKAPAKESGA